MLAVCEACKNAGSNARPQLRWDRLKDTLDEMEASGEHYRTITVD